MLILPNIVKLFVSSLSNEPYLDIQFERSQITTPILLTTTKLSLSKNQVIALQTPFKLNDVVVDEIVNDCNGFIVLFSPKIIRKSIISRKFKLPISIACTFSKIFLIFHFN